MHQFIGRSDVHAVNTPDGWKAVRSPLTDDVLAAHLRGDYAVGTYLVEGDRCRHAVLDVDTGDFEDVRRLAKQGAVRLDAVPFVTTSGRKGWHLWWFFPTWVKAADVRHTLGDLVRPKVELFPKQSQVRDLGNPIRLPGGVHPVTGNRCEIVGRGLIEMADPELLLMAPTVEHRPYAGSVKRMLQAPVDVGERNNTLYGWATWCAWTLGLPQDLAEEWATRLIADWPEPLTPTEIERTIASAYAHEPPERSNHA